MDMMGLGMIHPLLWYTDDNQLSVQEEHKHGRGSKMVVVEWSE
jgi:hypothetical protein